MNIEQAIVQRVHAAAQAEDVAQAMNDMQVLKQRVRMAETLMEQALIEWIQEHGELVVGETRYYVGTKKNVKCNDMGKTVAALFVAAGGDEERFCGCLSSNAIKHGAARGILPPEVFDSLFTTTEETDLKTGAPRKRVLAAAPEYIKRKGGGPTEAEIEEQATETF